MIQIFVDSGANLSPELREQYNIHLLPMALTIDDQPAPEGLDGHEYYEALRSGADVRTSMVNPDDARKAFEPYIAQGDDVVYFSISAGISGSWWSAKLAGDELMEQYPQRRVCPIDSMGASLGAGIPALKASSLVRQGMGLDELVEKMTVYCQNYCQYFAVDDLKYLRKGGRLPAAVAVAGGMLGIKPLITIKEGKVAMAGKARGLPGAYVALFKKIEELGGVNPRFPSLAGYTISTREVNPIQTYLVDNLGLPEPLVRQIGCVIGTHAGPGAFGLAFFDNGLVID